MSSEKMEEDILADNLGINLRGMFQELESERAGYEDQWIADLKQYKGVYPDDVKISDDRSHAFIRLTRTKVKTMDARMGDMLFPAGTQKNWSISPTPVPEINPLLRQKIENGFRSQEEEFDESMVEDAVSEYVKATCSNMEKEIDDQLKEAKYSQVCRDVIHDGNLYGTGILKGPMVESKASKCWQLCENGDYEIAEKTEKRPYFERVSIFDVYPEVSARSIEDSERIFQRHLMTKSQLRSLAKRNDFDGRKIADYIKENQEGDYQAKNFETRLKDIDTQNQYVKPNKRRYEVLEYWGYATFEELEELCVDLGLTEDEKKKYELEEFEINAFVLGQTTIKAVLNPTRQKSKPYRFFYFEKDETSIYGVGLAQILADTSEIFNSALRMMLDNAAITAGPQIEVDVEQLDPGTDPTNIYPFKIWLKKSKSMNSDRPLIRTYTFDSTTNEMMKIMEFIKNIGDEASAVPSYMQGVPSGGAAKTVGGLSMLMGASNITVKDVVKNFDEGITKPAIEDTYNWNMQFNDKEDIKGDYTVVAKGSSSLVAKEIRANSLQQFYNLAGGNSEVIDVKELLKEIVLALDLPESLIKEDGDDPQVAALKQQITQLKQLIESKSAEMDHEKELKAMDIAGSLEKADVQYGQDYQGGIEQVDQYTDEGMSEIISMSGINQPMIQGQAGE